MPDNEGSFYPQQWIFDYIIRMAGKTAHWELDATLDRLPVEVKSWDMIPKVLEKQAAGEEEFGWRAEEADAFFSEVAGSKEMWVMEDDFHIVFTRGLCNIPMAHMAADWLKDKLEGEYPQNLARRVLIPLNGTGPYS